MSNKPLVDVQVIKHPTLRKKLSFVANAYRLAQASQELSDLLVRRLRKRFIAGIDARGEKWAPYSKNTKRRGSKGMLRNTDTLLNSIKRATSGYEGVKSNTGAGFRITAAARKDGDGFQYGVVHNKGNARTPQRNFLGINSADEAALLRKFKFIIDKKAKLL